MSEERKTFIRNFVAAEQRAKKYTRQQLIDSLTRTGVHFKKSDRVPALREKLTAHLGKVWKQYIASERDRQNRRRIKFIVFDHTIVFKEFDGLQQPSTVLNILRENNFAGTCGIKFRFNTDVHDERWDLSINPYVDAKKVNLHKINIDMRGVTAACTVAKDLTKYYQSYGDFRSAPDMFISKYTYDKIPYPPVFVNNVPGGFNCALKVYTKYLPRGKNAGAINKYFAQLNKNISAGGFTESVAAEINNKYGYGCTMFDQLGNATFSYDSRNNMRHIFLQAFDQHVYEYKTAITDRYFPTHVQIFVPNDLKSWYQLAVEICEQGPQIVYRTNLENTKERIIVGIKTANIEYKSSDMPLGIFDGVDVLLSKLRATYPQNFVARSAAELSWLKHADFHGPTIWYDKPQKGFEVDFNQAYRAAAELKLATDLATKYMFPNYPVFWYCVYDCPDEQSAARELINQYSGFAELYNIDYSNVEMPLREYMSRQNIGHVVFTSPEIAYFDEVGITYTITAIAYNQICFSIDWGFVSDNENPTINKNINRIVMGRIISLSQNINQIIICDKHVTDYYVRVIGDAVINVDKSCDQYDRIQYECIVKPKHNQQYHIHAYILAYLRLAMWDLLSNIDPQNVIKINVDAVHLKNVESAELTEFMGYEIDNSPMGKLGCIKLNRALTRGDYTEPPPNEVVECKFPHDYELPGQMPPQMIMVGGAAGSGKTELLSQQDSLTCVASFTNKLANNLRTRNDPLTSANVQTMHAKYGIEFADPTYKVKRVPMDHLHNLDDVLLAPPKMVKNIVDALIKHGKRITITYGPGQATMNKISSIKLMDYLRTNGFTDIILEGSHRMDPDLYKISESYRNDNRINQVLCYDQWMAPISAEIDSLARKYLECKSESTERELKSLKHVRWEKYLGPKTRLIEQIITHYKNLFAHTSEETALRQYVNDPFGYVMVTSTNDRRFHLNVTILMELAERSPEIHKYRYNTKVNRMVKSWWGDRIKYTRYRSQIVEVRSNDDLDEELIRDINSGYVDDMHVTTVHSCQGETVESKILIDLEALFDPDIFYSAITRPRHLADIILFEDVPATYVLEDDIPDTTIRSPEPINIELARIAPTKYSKLSEIVADELAENSFLIHTEFPHRHFLLFKSYDHFYSWSQSQPLAERCYHEVVCKDIRKVVVDIDGKDIPRSEWKVATDKFVRAFRQTFGEVFKRSIGDLDIVLISSSGYSKASSADKFSLQIRTRDYVNNRASCKKFARKYASSLGDYGKYVDTGVYKSVQNFRCVGSTKKDDDRHSSIVNNKSIRDSMVGFSDFPLRLPMIAESAAKIVEAPIGDELTARIIAAAEEYTDGLTYVYYNGVHTFRRQVPSLCCICDREHSSDNMYVCNDSGNINLRCRRGDHNEYITLFTLADETVVSEPIESLAIIVPSIYTYAPCECIDICEIIIVEDIVDDYPTIKSYVKNTRKDKIKKIYDLLSVEEKDWLFFKYTDNKDILYEMSINDVILTVRRQIQSSYDYDNRSLMCIDHQYNYFIYRNMFEVLGAKTFEYNLMLMFVNKRTYSMSDAFGLRCKLTIDYIRRCYDMLNKRQCSEYFEEKVTAYRKIKYASNTNVLKRYYRNDVIEYAWDNTPLDTNYLYDKRVELMKRVHNTEYWGEYIAHINGLGEQACTDIRDQLPKNIAPEYVRCVNAYIMERIERGRRVDINELYDCLRARGNLRKLIMAAETVISEPIKSPAVIKPAEPLAIALPVPPTIDIAQHAGNAMMDRLDIVFKICPAFGLVNKKCYGLFERSPSRYDACVMSLPMPNERIMAKFISAHTEQIREYKKHFTIAEITNAVKYDAPNWWLVEKAAMESLIYYKVFKPELSDEEISYEIGATQSEQYNNLGHNAVKGMLDLYGSEHEFAWYGPDNFRGFKKLNCIYSRKNPRKPRGGFSDE